MRFTDFTIEAIRIIFAWAVDRFPARKQLYF